MDADFSDAWSDYAAQSMQPSLSISDQMASLRASNDLKVKMIHQAHRDRAKKSIDKATM